MGQGTEIPEATRQFGVITQTYYRWRKEYGGLKTGQAKKLKDLERENARLRKLVAGLSVNKAML